MHFIVILAFALVLSDGLPPKALDVFRTPPGLIPTASVAFQGTLAVVVAQVFLVSGVAWFTRRRALASLQAAPGDHDRVAGILSDAQRTLLGMLGAALLATLLLTPWTRLARETWGLSRWPLVAEAVILAPFLISVLASWIILFPAERALRHALRETTTASPAAQGAMTDAQAALAAAKRRPSHGLTLAAHLADNVRHQILTIAAPMLVVVFAKHYTDSFADVLENATGLTWLHDCLLGCVSAMALGVSPAILRRVWATEPLPTGPLRRRFELACKRIGLRYRDILIWHTHGAAVNAAVMGFVAPLRYVLVTDALLETMKDEEIEAVFAHEAGHVREHHLPFFVLFFLSTIYVAGGLIELLARAGLVQDFGSLQLIALAVLAAAWLFGFGWLSRRFERQADLYAVRAMSAEVVNCVDYCAVHGRNTPTPGREEPRGTGIQPLNCGAGLHPVDCGTGLQPVEPGANSNSEGPRSSTGNGPQAARLNDDTAMTPIGNGTRPFLRVSADAPPALLAAAVQAGPRKPTGPARGDVCIRASNLFGRTLLKIADLNGIPRDAPSWRHGTIQSRCVLVERWAANPAALRRFDRDLVAVKLALFGSAALGTAAAAWLYGRDILRALGG